MVGLVHVNKDKDISMHTCNLYCYTLIQQDIGQFMLFPALPITFSEYTTEKKIHGKHSIVTYR